MKIICQVVLDREGIQYRVGDWFFLYSLHPLKIGQTSCLLLHSNGDENQASVITALHSTILLDALYSGRISSEFFSFNCSAVFIFALSGNLDAVIVGSSACVRYSV